nr:hypothetical protein [Candidatus Freyarchaeota archaeon]
MVLNMIHWKGTSLSAQYSWIQTVVTVIISSFIVLLGGAVYGEALLKEVKALKRKSPPTTKPDE